MEKKKAENKKIKTSADKNEEKVIEISSDEEEKNKVIAV